LALISLRLTKADAERPSNTPPLVPFAGRIDEDNAMLKLCAFTGLSLTSLWV